MKLFKTRYLIVSAIVALLLSGGWFAWAAIQQEVGLNLWQQTTSTWVKASEGTLRMGQDNNIITPGNFGILDTDTLIYGINTAGTADRIRAGLTADGNIATGLLNPAPLGFNGATFDRLRSSSNTADTLATSAVGNANTISFPFIFNGATFDRVRSISGVNSTSGTGLLASAPLLFDSGTSTYVRQATASSFTADQNLGSAFGIKALALYNGSTLDRGKGISAINLTATTSAGTTLTAPLTTWTCTSNPGIGLQATCTKAAGGGTVRHVLTGITACNFDAAAPTSAGRLINLRDGTSGAGTVLWSAFVGAGLANESKCITPPPVSIIGSANTAMTLEFNAAGAATLSQTVTLSGFSVP